MEAQAAPIAVGTIAVRLATGKASTSLALQCLDGDFYLGGSGVTTANGIRVAAGEIFSVAFDPGQSIYAIAASTVNVRVLRSDD